MPTRDIPAPMTGTVREVLVNAGDTISTGQELVILESMKMEIPVESPVSGQVSDLLVTPDQQIEEGQLLLRVEAP
ncbi:MAG: acetyl-CoA carboxylase biotin carboxyl carrier protein subunit [Hyphomicrobiales bacterium]